MKSRLAMAAMILTATVALPVLSHGEALKVGDKAPDFTLKDANWKDAKLSDYLGKKNVVLAFYILAFTGG